MIGLAFRRLFLFSKNVRIPTTEEVKAHWDDYSQEYNVFDLGPQTFYYTLTSIMELHKADNILQVACGTGKLLPVALDRKRLSCSYLASDIAPNMIEQAKLNLKQHFMKYQSQLSFQSWCSQQNLKFEVLNAEEPIPQSATFDRIICNCALMITSDASKMMNNLYAHSKKGCLFGLSIWGSKKQNNLFSCIRQSIEESGFELPEERSNFHLYKKVGSLAEQTGWQLLLNWQQNALFPVLQFQPGSHKELLHHQINKLPEYQRQKVTAKLHQKVAQVFKSKKGLNFSVQMFVLRRK